MSIAKQDGNWVVIHIARGAAKADRACDVLSGEGFVAKRRPVSGLDGDDGLQEVLALSSEAKEARATLIEKGIS